MPKVKRPRIAGPAGYDEAPAAPRAARPAPRARDIPYSVAWFRDRVATYALGTIICGAAMLTVAAWMGGSLGAFGQRMNSGFDVIASWAGLSVKEVKVCSAIDPAMDVKAGTCVSVDPILEAKVKEAAGVRVGGNILMADPYAIQHKVEGIESVGPGAAGVRRLWPDRLDITVEQRKPIALYQTTADGDWRVIDQSGEAFAAADPAKYVNLPRVVGENAAEAAATLVTAIGEFPNLATRMEIAYRVGGRRWDLKFRGRADVVVLPVDAQMTTALECLNLAQANTRVLDLPAMRIDARKDCVLAIQEMSGARQTTVLPPGGA